VTTIQHVTLTFARDAQNELPLRSAAYRMAGFGTCQIDASEGRWVCSLKAIGQNQAASDALARRFLAVLNDENLREQIELRTAPVRDVILALAFGALVDSGSKA
jgi:His-Xaa-Ser system protein HxsD